MRRPTLPPPRRRLVAEGRLQKRWRYVGLWGPDLMLCAGKVRVGGLPQAFWAVWDPAAAALHERTTSRPGRVALPGDAVRVLDGAVRIDVVLEPAGTAVEVRSPHPTGDPGPNRIWTRKTPVRGRGVVELPGTRPRPVDLHGLVDDSAGFHARRTSWRWSAGVGTAEGGERLCWNLVEGLHDAPTGSERQLWVDGVPREVAPVAIAPALDAVALPGGGGLAFAEQARREREDRMAGGLLTSSYLQPFGTFTGAWSASLPVALGWGVMERHDAGW